VKLSRGPLQACLLTACLICMSGCFGRTKPTAPPVPENIPNSTKSVSIKKEPVENPYALRIVDEVNDGHTLHIAAEVKSSVALEALPAVLRLTTLNSGEPVQVSYYPVARGVRAEQTRTPGKDGLALSFDLSAGSENITDYQLELLWGQEALEHLPSNNLRAPALQLRNLTIQPSGCQSTVACMGKLRIMAELFNPGLVPVPTATLGIGFIWQANGAPPPDPGEVPQREQKLVLNTLNLDPGRSRPVTLTVNRDIPKQPGGQYRPVLRIVDPPGDNPL
jgi:hypothetical protein